VRHLLHIGYPKAGSTYLQRWFEAHPQFAYAAGRIAAFDSVYSIARECAAASSDAPYRVTSSEVLAVPGFDAGRPSIDYGRYAAFDMAAAQSRVCSTLASLFPGATVLVITRGFRAVIRSALSQYARSGGDTDARQLIAGHEADGLAVVYHYDRLIAEYERAFGAENVIVMPFELLRDDADAFIRTIAARLGVEPISAPSGRINEGISPAELVWYPRLTRLARRLPSQRLFDRYIGAVERGRLRSAVNVLQRLRPGTPVDAIPEEFVERFRGRAESLRGNSLYAPYAAEYLNA